jgi:dTDP-4-dehydrorhamnose reductase
MTSHGDAMELWGGLECTVNRVGSQYFDQLELSGHAGRSSDIERIASLGIRTVRYPILWERTAPSTPREADWSWSDERMELLEQHGITPIVGFVHHGSGPRHTSLLDDQFAEKLADYARAVAERYPQIRYVTPINEPLTTARFSTLYGHWYPHRRSWRDFANAVVNQCLATRAAIKAMREVIPSVKFVQTEDLGRVYSTQRLAYQAAFENERRWLTFDLLTGRVDQSHSMWKHLALDELMEEQLHSLRDDPSPPDIIGVNYYVTSDRFLDERIDLHPEDVVGGNGRDRYADVEAVRAVEEGIAGHKAILCEAWERYRIPLAVTEVHLGCTREHQLRWLREAWQGACDARRAGCDVVAVTAWALFGSFGWDSLVTRRPFTYEPGAFDVRSPQPRETAIAKLVRELAASGSCDHPAADTTGWWREDARLSVPSFSAGGQRSGAVCGSVTPRPVLITGARGTLGSAFARCCEKRGLEAVAMSHSQLDIANAASVRRAIDIFKPWAIINAAGYVRVDDAESDRSRCYRANVEGVSVLARACSRAGIPLVTFSSDLVFDGSKPTPYVESDCTAPLNVYGASKVAAELCVAELHRDSLVIRTSAFFGPWDEWNFPLQSLLQIAHGIPLDAACDLIVSPTYVPDLVDASLDLLIDGETGIWHLANSGAASWSDLARDIASRAGFSPDLVRPLTSAALGLAAQRPAYSVLGSERGSLLSSLDNALERWLDAIHARELDTAPALLI